MFGSVFSGLKAWYAAPYSPTMSASKWFLLVGLVLLSLAVWKIIVWHLMDV